jgi:hypothetical protein
MRYYGLLFLVLVSLIASVIVQGRDIFTSASFAIAYAVMSLVLVIGTKYKESSWSDFALGLLLICAVGFMSTETLIEMVSNKFTGALLFKTGIIIALDYCAIGFFRGGVAMKKMEEVKGDGRYAIQ